MKGSGPLGALLFLANLVRTLLIATRGGPLPPFKHQGGLEPSLG